ncbi:MAG: hypothetical protein Q4B26_03865 [Eubacteriales bacterium]|nr:hypothetical protein [Eubacteriales bacterium]
MRKTFIAVGAAVCSMALAFGMTGGITNNQYRVFAADETEAETLNFLDMSDEEFEAYQSEMKEESDRLWNAYENAANAADERNEDGKIVYTIGDLKITYAGDIEVQSILQEEEKTIVLYDMENREEFLSVAVYDKTVNETAHETIMSKEHVHTDEADNEYYSAESADGAIRYITYTDAENGEFILINTTGSFKPDMIEISK